MTTSGHAFVRPRAGGNILVPTGSRRGALAGVSLLTRSRTPAVTAQWLLFGAVAVAGPRVIPGTRVGGEPPGGAALWQALSSRVGPFDGLALYERPQGSRTGVAAVLLHRGRPAGFLKVRDEPDTLDREVRALSAFPGGQAAGFRVPKVLDRDETHGSHWMLIEAMPPRPARPLRGTVLAVLVAQIQRRLAVVVPRPPGTPDHWLPMHGDLTVWNLRRCGAGLPWLIDWEDARWAPPGADRVYYEATHTAVFGRPPASRELTGPAEAVLFWTRQVERRPAADRDAPFNARLRAALRAMCPAA
ncbi:phosphotransferase [Actinomadura fibrosa]|uniref:Phosphotransferase n=1 Tax=Actinomadura fibrosa TaxID=111802 RepID=A0ABW2XFB1_9ACTN|nr:phosphotransferase [Actinomadura fibrosa]